MRVLYKLSFSTICILLCSNKKVKISLSDNSDSIFKIGPSDNLKDINVETLILCYKNRAL